MVFRHLGVRAGLVFGVAALAVAGLAGPAAASVSSRPASTPQLYPNGSVEQVRQLVQCGGTMFAVGTFTKIQQGASGPVYTRNNVVSFRATSPFTITKWAPNVNGKVNTIAFNGTNCGTAYIGGVFTSVNGTAVRDFAAISTFTGAVVTGIAHNANGQVETIAYHGGHLLTGGRFTSISGSGADPYFTSLSPSTGKNDGYLNLHISGTYGNNATMVYNQQISHGGALDLAEGVFTSVGGKARRQIFMLSLGSTSATVNGWTSSEFSQSCVSTEAFYVRAASWSPGDSTVYIATTGFHLASTGRVAGGLCDVAAAFPATPTSVHHLWVNFTGCDSLYSTAADSSTAYFGGHERWASNPNGCNFAGPGAVSAQGMVGLSPTDGHVIFNPTRSRGLGADDMLVTSAGLWIASDNAFNATKCAKQSGHAGICFLPYG
jgi:hypothetical protein